MAMEPPASAAGGDEPVRMAQLIEGVVGNAWAADSAGRFVYVTPATLAAIGMTLEDLNAPPHDLAYGWKRVIHPSDYGAAAEAWKRSLESGASYDVEHRMLCKPGVYAWFRCAGRPLLSDDGRAVGWYGAVMKCDDPAQVVADGAPPLDQVHPEDRAAVAQAFARAFWGGVPQVVNCRQRQDDGSYRLTEIRADPGYAVGVEIEPLVFRQDELWTTTDALGDTVEAVRAAKVVESMHGAAFAFDASGKFTYATPIAQTSIAMTLEDLNRPLGERTFVEGGDLGWKLGVHPEDYEGAAARLRHCMRTGEDFNYEYRVLRASGEYVWHRFAIRPTRDADDRVTGWYGIGFDIDVYKKTEAALRKRELELSQLIDMTPSHIWRLTPEGEPTFFNKRMADYLGMDVADTDQPGTRRLDAVVATIHPDDATKFKELLETCLDSGAPFSMRYRLRRADGVYHWMSSRAEPVLDDAGSIVQWYGICHDIDDQVRIEGALRDRERFLLQLVETLPAMVDCANAEGEPIYRSQQLCEFLGYELKDLDGERGSRLLSTLEASVHPDDLAGVKERYARSLRTGEPYAFRHRLRRADGVFRWVETRAAPMRNAEDTIVQWNVICLDIDAEVRAQDELRIAQERLARASQAASLAELSASIAHEVNQPLAAVVTNSHACGRWLAAEPPNLDRAKATVERIIRDANAAADVVSRTRALFRHAPPSGGGASLTAIVGEAERLIKDIALRRRIRIETHFAADLPPVAIDQVQLQQVLVNLMRNGVEAMDEGAGKVLSVAARGEGACARIDVRDQGPGVAQPESVFDAFFTTKDNGMGVGLAVARSIVEAHGGRLWIENGADGGAVFAFTLPFETREVA